jgi:hypothetical protein
MEERIEERTACNKLFVFINGTVKCCEIITVCWFRHTDDRNMILKCVLIAHWIR